MNYPQILAELGICDKFLPPAVKKSSRYIYFEMVSAACTVIIEQESKIAVVPEGSPKDSFGEEFMLGSLGESASLGTGTES
jgi:hypothetical protein